MASHTLLVFSNAADGRDDEFNHWYTSVHLPDVLGVEGFVAARRFRLADVQLLPGQAVPHRYLAIYEIEAEDVNGPLEALKTGVATGAIPLSQTLDRGSLATYLFSPISERLAHGT
jgi:hypothetical protein